MSIHPEILSLQRLKDQARDQVQKNQWESLLDSLWCWNIELKEVDQDKELIDKIHKEKITLDGFAYPGGKNTRMRDMKKIYKRWYSQTMKNTWEKGYFEKKKYAPETKRDTTFDKVKEVDGGLGIMDQLLIEEPQEQIKFNIPEESMLWEYIGKAAKGGPTAKIIFIAITSQVEGKIKSEGLPYGQGKSIFSAILAGQIYEIFDSFLGLAPYKAVQENMGYTWDQHIKAVEDSNIRRKTAYIMDDLQRIAGKSKSRDPYVQSWAEFFTTARPFFGVIIFTCPNVGDLAKCFRELINFEIKIPKEGEYEVQFIKAISNFRKPMEPLKLMRYKGEGIIPRAPKWFVDWYIKWRKESSYDTFLDRIKNYGVKDKKQTTLSKDDQWQMLSDKGLITCTRAEYRRTIEKPTLAP